MITRYEQYHRTNGQLMSRIGELHGKDLICWCAPEPCHADVLRELANSVPGDGC